MLVVTGLTAGGAERVVVNLADYFAIKGHAVTLVFMTDKEKIFFLPKNEKIDIVDLDITKNPVSFLLGLRKLARLIKEKKVDIVHSHMFHANILACVARIFTPMNRLICSSHNTNEGGDLRMLMYRLTDSIPDLRTNVSQEAVDIFIEKKATKKGNMIPIINGIDTDYFKFCQTARNRVRKDLKLADENKLIVAAGRLTEAKGFSILLHAFKAILAINKNVRLAIAGIGPLENELKSLVMELQIEEHVSFLGVYNEMPALMSATDIFVLSSLWEGFGLVVAEAMACERVVVATDSGGVKEVLGDCGFLVSQSETDLLATGIEQALNLDEAEKSELGKRARSRIISNFSLEKNAEAYFNLY